jgi:hypothetical protein
LGLDSPKIKNNRGGTVTGESFVKFLLLAVVAGAKTLRQVSILALFAVLISLAPSTVHAQCAGKCDSDEYLSGMDNQFCYCTKYSDRRALEGSINAISVASGALGCIGGDYCNFFVARIGRERNIPYLRDIVYPGGAANQIGGSDEERRANEIYDFISRAVGSGASGWRQVMPDNAQEMANQGKFVLGVSRNRDPSRSGHVVVVAPAQMNKSGSGTGPWVRDSQNPSESVRASRRFGSSVVTPIWAVWQHEVK